MFHCWLARDPDQRLRCDPVVASFRFAPGIWWAEYVGILYHLAMFLLVFKLPAPEWAKAAGYGWLLLDVAAECDFSFDTPKWMFP